MSQSQWVDFLARLAEVEVKYWQHLRGIPLKDCYILDEDENGVLRFRFNEECDLAEHIKEECFKLFDAAKADIEFNSRKQA